MIDFDISTICIGIIIFAVLTLMRKWYKNKKRYVFQILMFVYLMMVIEKTLFPIEFIDLEYNIWDRINFIGSIIGYGIYLLVGFCVKLLHSANTNKDGKV